MWGACCSHITRGTVATVGALGVLTVSVVTECSRPVQVFTFIDIHAGQLGHVQLEALEAVAGVALLNTHTAAILAAIQDAALLCLQAFEASLVFWLACHIVGLEFRGRQWWLLDRSVFPWVTGRVGEGQLRDDVLRAQVVVEGSPIWVVEVVVKVVRPWAILVTRPELHASLPLCLDPGYITQLSVDLRAPRRAQSTLLAPGLSILAAALRVGGAAPVQGLAAHIVCDFLPADIHVDVVIRQLLRAAGAVHTVLPAVVQGERWAAVAVERAIRVHTLAILAYCVLAFIMIFALPAGSIVVVARMAQADIARHRIEAPAILAESRPEHHTFICIRVGGLSKHPGAFHRDVALPARANLTEFN